VLLSFLGKSGWPAPPLEKAQFKDIGELKSIYWNTVLQMKVMYQRSRLVHADLSPYNILYHKNLPYFIDLAQAVTVDHPQALQFLKRDCFNITKFFRCRKLRTILSARELFDFIIDSSDTNNTEDSEYSGEQQIQSSINTFTTNNDNQPDKINKTEKNIL